MSAPRTRHTAALAAGLGLLGTAALGIGFAVAGAPAGAAVSAGAVVSEVYGGGGNSGATLTNDFIELANRGTAAVPVDGYSVQYLPAAPSASSTWQVTPVSGSIAAGGRYLVAEGKGSGGTTALPSPDASGAIAMSGTAGTVALVNSTAALTCKTAADCAGDPSIVDLVGYGTAAVREGSPAPATSNTTSDARPAGLTDTDDNSTDFVNGAPTPTNTKGEGGGGTTPPPPTGEPATIDQIQGTGFLSPYAGMTVDTDGVVTAVGPSGFWIQRMDPDSDPRTSEGVYVYTGSAAKPAVGDDVSVVAAVSEYDPQASHASTSLLTVTELSKATVTVTSSGNALPAPVVLTPTSVPDTYAFDNGGNSIETMTLDPTRSALDYYESLEGMRIEVDDARVVGPSNSYGEQYVTTKPDQARTYRGGAELLGDNQTPSGRLEVAPLTGTANLGLDVNDELAGATVGPLDYSSFGGYILRASTLGTITHDNLPRVVAKPGSTDQLSIATYNVENLAPTNPDSKFTALAKGVVTNLASPDVVALEEIQDNDGANDDGVVDATKTLNKLTSKIAKAGGPRYKYREIDPVNDEDGGEPGGNIRVAFLYNPARVGFVGAGSTKVNRSTTATQVTDDYGRPGLTLSPGRIAPTDEAWDSSRKPLVGQFRFQGKDVFVIANHFDSKGGDQSADGRFQYPQQSSRVQREKQATLVHDFVQKLLGVDSQADVVVVGDLNDYQFSSPLATLKTGTPDGRGPSILTDLITTLPVDQQYTYVYNGVSQVLDHILASGAVTGRPFTYQVVHVNAEYHDQVSDHDPQVVDVTP